MTAINCAPQGKIGYLYADTAHTDAETGRVLHFASKLLLGTNFPWAMAISGYSRAQAAAIEAINAEVPRNVTGFVRALPGILKRIEATADAQGSLSLTLLVWDGRLQRTRAFVIDNDGSANGGLGIEPGTVAEVDWSACGGDPAAYLERPVEMTRRSSFDPDDYGLALMLAQRRGMTWGPSPDCAVCPRIGGEVEQAVVTRRGVQVYSLHRWPDRVGEKIAA